jgi:ABC-type long-subunit fatty acid transport system fused permease/ATPase subunit
MKRKNFNGKPIQNRLDRNEFFKKIWRVKWPILLNQYIYINKKAGRLDNHLLGLLDRSHEKTLYFDTVLPKVRRFFILAIIKIIRRLPISFYVLPNHEILKLNRFFTIISRPVAFQIKRLPAEAGQP